MKFLIVFCTLFSCVACYALPVEGKYQDCHERWKAGERKSGVYQIYPNTVHPVDVFCDHRPDASLTIIQRRIDASVSFALPFVYYKQGFGNPYSDYWAGLDNIYHLTRLGNTKLTIYLQDWAGNQRYATYSHFSILDQSQGYRLSIYGFYGNVPDDMSFQNGMYFYTMDYPDPHGCATHMQAGWWYNYCAYSLLNGKFYLTPHYTPPSSMYDGIYWKDWMGYNYSLRSVSMSVSRY